MPRSANHLHFVIPTGAKRKGGTCSALSAATTLRTLHPNNQYQGQPTISTLSSRQERSGRERSALSAATTLRTLHPNNRRQGQPTISTLSSRQREAEGRGLQCPLGRNHSQNPPSK